MKSEEELNGNEPVDSGEKSKDFKLMMEKNPISHHSA